MTDTRSTLEGQVAFVTGAARGIGRGIAARLAREGAAVVIWDRDAAAFDASAAGFVPAAVVGVDVSDFGSVERGFAATMERTKRLDILVNNAGVNGPVAPVWEYPLDAWDRVLAVDLTGVFYCCRVAVPAMRAAGYGRIVNVSSITGKEGSAGIAAYASAKAGVIGFASRSPASSCVGRAR
jgi:3-oxoacyl-[acyl-carrier protein] reductase